MSNVDNRRDASAQKFGPLPNTLIIGVQKSSTTWLSRKLAQHEDVFMVRKEIHYFSYDVNYGKGERWYRAKFQRSQGQQVICEKTGSYFWTSFSDGVHQPRDKVERIHALVPDAKLIVILRDPVFRAISAWNHNVRVGLISPHNSIEDIFAEKNRKIVDETGILTRGLYCSQLNDFYRLFSKNQVLILFQETDVIAAPDRGLEKVCNFLGLPLSSNFHSLGRADNKFESTFIGNKITASSPRVLKPVTERLDRYVLTLLGLKKISYPKPSTRVLNSLVEYYGDDVRRLSTEVSGVPEKWMNSK